MFVSSDPAKFVYDLRLKPGAMVIRAGNSAEAPPVDITGAPRAGRVDIGAYQQARTNRHRFWVLATRPLSARFGGPCGRS